MTKNEIAIRIATELGMPQVEVKRIVQMVLDGMVETIAAEKRLELRKFGIFTVRTRQARKGRNPRTGEEVMVPARNVVTFKPGKLMEEKVAHSSDDNDSP